MQTPTEDFIDTQAAAYIELADSIWNYAELGYQEQHSSAAHVDYLQRHGFRITRGVAGIPTAFVAEAGSGGPILGILGEFDALAQMSQESRALECRPSSEIMTGHGHGCGHHLLGTAAHLAAAGVKDYLDTSGTPGTVRFYGCPAEEGGFGKTFMAREGLFDDLSVALTWHPGPFNAIKNKSYLAVKQAYFRFTGRAAHAGESPHLGRSALDALELMNVGVNFMREHMPSNARVHYAITDAGGLAPNVVQASAEALYMIRAPHNQEVDALYQRVSDIAKGAALMTGCQVQVEFHSGCSNMVLNDPLNHLLYANLQRLGAPRFDADDEALAKGMHETTRPDERAHMGRWLTAAWRDPKPLFDKVDTYDPRVIVPVHGSTDVGDVSWITPTAQFMTTCFAFGTPPHSWQWVAQGKSGIAHKGMVLAAKVIASTAIDILRNPSHIETARQHWHERRGGIPYRCPIPVDVLPPPQRT